MRSTAPVRRTFMFCSKARGLAWKMASIQLCASGEFSPAPAAVDAIEESVSPRCTTCELPPASSEGDGVGGATDFAVCDLPLWRPVGAGDVSLLVDADSPAPEAIAADVSEGELGAACAVVSGVRAIAPS